MIIIDFIWIIIIDFICFDFQIIISPFCLGFAIAANGMVINKAIYFGAYYSFNKTILDHTNSLVSHKEKDAKLPFWIRFTTAQV